MSFIVVLKGRVGIGHIRIFIVLGLISVASADAFAYVNLCRNLYKISTPKVREVNKVFKTQNVTLDVTNATRNFDALGESYLEITNGLEAVAVAIRKFTNDPVKIDIVFIDKFFDQDGNPVNQHAGFLIRDGAPAILISMDNIAEFGFLGIKPLNIILLMILGHEATHWGQHLRGDRLVSSTINHNYSKDPHEIEAWQGAVQVLKQFYPGVRGAFRIGDYNVHIPEKHTDTPQVTFEPELVH